MRDINSTNNLSRIRFRAVMLGLFLLLVNCYWTTAAEIKYSMGDASTLPLFIYPIFILFVIAILNLLWRKFFPRSSLSKSELLVIYIMVVVSSTFLGKSMLAGMLGSITYPFRYATPENE